MRNSTLEFEFTETRYNRTNVFVRYSGFGQMTQRFYTPVLCLYQEGFEVASWLRINSRDGRHVPTKWRYPCSK